MKKKSSIISVLMVALAGVTVTVLLIFVLLMVKDKREKAEELLKYRITSEKAKREKTRDYLEFAIEETLFYRQQLEIKENDNFRLLSEEYSAFQACMWNTDELDEEWYATLFGEPIVFSDYSYETPQEFTELVSKGCTSDNAISTVYLGIDPSVLKKNYYNSVYYDMEILPFEEYVSDYLVETIASFPETNFKVILPMKSLTSWSNMTEDELDETFGDWYTFIMLLHWAPNATVSFAGNEEWLIANDNNYVSEYELTDELSKYMFIQNYIGYDVHGPEILEREENLRVLIDRKRNGLYKYKDLNDYEIVYFGDSVLANHAAYSSCIASAVSAFTKAKCDNRSVGGSSASGESESSFGNVVKQYIEEDISSDIPRIFFVEYGFNDYFTGAVIDNPQNRKDINSFGGALRNGIELIKERYPESTIVLVSPYSPNMNEKGTLSCVEGGATIPELSDMVMSISSEYGIECLNLYNNPGVAVEEINSYLVDGVHPSFEYEFILAEKYAETIS